MFSSQQVNRCDLCSCIIGSANMFKSLKTSLNVLVHLKFTLMMFKIMICNLGYIWLHLISIQMVKSDIGEYLIHLTSFEYLESRNLRRTYSKIRGLSPWRLDTSLEWSLISTSKPTNHLLKTTIVFYGII